MNAGQAGDDHRAQGRQGARPRPSSSRSIEGTGPEVKKGQTVRVAYTGALLKDGSVFDSSASHPEQPAFDFVVGSGQVIKGWDNGLQGQKVGSRVLLVIPPAEGYGTAGSPPKISGNDTLVFVVDILAAY